MGNSEQEQLVAEPPPISENSIYNLSRIERDKEGCGKWPRVDTERKTPAESR